MSQKRRLLGGKITKRVKKRVKKRVRSVLKTKDKCVRNVKYICSVFLKE